jgi:hypothetical protein
MSKPILNGHWKFPEQLGGKEYAGFVYIIRDNYMGLLYLGKKNYRGRGKLNRGVESNWKKYISSSNKLKIQLDGRPRSEFEFIAVEQYKTQGTLSYSETWSLCHVEAPTSDVWYNTLIEKVSWPVREGITVRHKTRMDRAIEGGLF